MKAFLFGFALLVALPAWAQDPESVARGAELWGKCRSCHTLAEGGRHTVGPNLHKLFGSKAGTREGYRYSDAMKASGLTWTEETVDRYIAATQEFMPGSKMYGGLAIEQDRIDLIAWLKAVESGAAPLPPR
ncbi:MAG: c-type cytochrome [Elsteraceae bacterium]